MTTNKHTHTNTHTYIQQEVEKKMYIVAKDIYIGKH